MSELIMRAEQGLLGVLLRDSDTVISAQLEPEDFGHPAHRAAYRALTDVELLGYDTVDERITAVAAIAEHAEVDVVWLRHLADTAPQPTLAPEYARIVVQAAFDRDVADFAQPYRAGAELAADTQTRETLLRVADALDAQAAVFTPAAVIDTDATVHLAVDVNATTVEVRIELHREDQIIADIVQHPEQAIEVAAWLESEVFSTEQRRLTFELAVSLGYDHDPYDPVTLAWHVARSRDIDRYYHADHSTAELAEDDYHYVSRLHATPIEAGAAVTVGRELLVEHVQATLALSATEAAQRATQVIPAQQVIQQPPLTQAPSIDTRPIEL